MPTYRCDGKNCGFATDNLGEFIQHIRKEERTSPASSDKPKRQHKTARDYIECPECYVNLERVLLKRGWTQPEEKSKKGLPL